MQMLVLLNGMTMETLNESVLCLQLTEKYKDIVPTAPPPPSSDAPSIAPRLSECLESLAVFDQLMPALEQVFHRSKAIYSKAIGDTVILLKLVMKEPIADASHLAQLLQIVCIYFSDIGKIIII